VGYIGQRASTDVAGKVFSFNRKVKVKLTLEQSTKAQRGSRGIALLFL
jgi:hypothetical protein